MRPIAKAKEPATVTETRCAVTTKLDTNAHARAAYDQLDKGVVRAQLIAEQGFLCAFCMRVIDAEAKDDRGVPTMTIAHRTPIDVDPSKALTWSNLLGSCDGGAHSNGRYRTCDFAQESRPLTIDPTNAGAVARLRYERRDGSSGLFITSDDAELRRDVEETLRLNAGELPVLREAVWKAFMDHCRTVRAYGRSAWNQAFPKWRGSGARLRAFLGVVEAGLARSFG